MDRTEAQKPRGPDRESRLPGADEEALLQRVAAGDVSAQRAFFDTYAPRLWRLLFRLTGEYDEAQDLTQETLVRVFGKLDRFDGRGSLHGWLARVGINVWRDDMRTRKRRVLKLQSMDHVASAGIHLDPLLQQQLQTAVGELSSDERAVLLMHDLEGYTHEEIGTALGIAAGSSRARLSRARARLRERLHGIHDREDA